MCQCAASSQAIVEPAPLSVVPASPTFYIFAPNLLHDGTYFVTNITVTNTATEHANNTIRITHISTDPTFVVFRVESDARDGVVLLQFDDGSADTYRYTIDPDLKIQPSRVVGYSIDDMVACDYQEGAVTIDTEGDAIAYAAHWDDGTTTIVPDNHDEYRPRGLRLGASCDSTNVPFAKLHELRQFGLYALYADGSNKLVGTSSLQLTSHLMRAPVELLRRRADPPEAAPPSAAPVAADPTWSSMLSGLAVGACVVFASRSLRRRSSRDT